MIFDFFPQKMKNRVLRKEKKEKGVEIQKKGSVTTKFMLYWSIYDQKQTKIMLVCMHKAP